VVETVPALALFAAGVESGCAKRPATKEGDGVVCESGVYRYCIKINGDRPNVKFRLKQGENLDFVNSKEAPRGALPNAAPKGLESDNR
jgi:hypothetical protein